MTFAELLNIIYLDGSNLAVLCLGITTLLSLFNFNKLNKTFRKLCYFLIWNLFIEFLARTFTHFGINNLPLLHLYTLGEFILLSWFYKSLLTKPLIFQKIYGVFVIGGSTLIILNSLFFQNIYGFNPLAKTFVQIIIIGFAVLYFYNLTEDRSFSPIIEKSLRLINSAIIIYYSGSLFIFMCNQIFIDQSELYKIFWAFNAVLNLIFQLLILSGIWKVAFRKIPLSS